MDRVRRVITAVRQLLEASTLEEDHKRRQKVKDEIDAAVADAAWIPVTERLPDQPVQVLVFFEYWGCDLATYTPETGEWDMKFISHWMPLPLGPGGVDFQGLKHT